MIEFINGNKTCCDQLLGGLRSYEEFKNALGHQESTNNYKSENSSGCIGRYQFCPGTFQRISKLVLGKTISKADFKKNPALQEKFFDKLIQVNISDVGDFPYYLMLLKKRVGLSVTASGMIAGMHLGGAKGVENLAKKGIDRKDGNGTPISSYVKRFSGYQIPGINENISYTPDNSTTGLKPTKKTKIKTNQKTNIKTEINNTQDFNITEYLPYIGYGALALVAIVIISSMNK